MLRFASASYFRLLLVICSSYSVSDLTSASFYLTKSAYLAVISLSLVWNFVFCLDKSKRKFSFYIFRDSILSQTFFCSRFLLTAGWTFYLSSGCCELCTNLSCSSSNFALFLISNASIFLNLLHSFWKNFSSVVSSSKLVFLSDFWSCDSSSDISLLRVRSSRIYLFRLNAMLDCRNSVQDYILPANICSI